MANVKIMSKARFMNEGTGRRHAADVYCLSKTKNQFEKQKNEKKAAPFCIKTVTDALAVLVEMNAWEQKEVKAS